MNLDRNNGKSCVSWICFGIRTLGIRSKQCKPRPLIWLVMNELLIFTEVNVVRHNEKRFLIRDTALQGLGMLHGPYSLFNATFCRRTWTMGYVAFTVEHWKWCIQKKNSSSYRRCICCMFDYRWRLVCNVYHFSASLTNKLYAKFVFFMCLRVYVALQKWSKGLFIEVRH